MEEKNPRASIAAMLERARTIKPRLSAATDRLNEALSQTEQELIKLQLGVRASVNLDHDETWYAALVFAREGKDWRLRVEQGIHDEEVPPDKTPVLSASRELRLKAVERLPDLVEKMVLTAEAEVQRVEAAREKAEALALELEIYRAQNLGNAAHAHPPQVEVRSVTSPADAAKPRYRNLRRMIDQASAKGDAE